MRSDESDLCGIPLSFCYTINPLQWHMSTGSEFFSISQCRGVDVTKLVFLSDQFPYRDDLPTKLGNITGRNIISCASLRHVFHWLSSLFKWYKSVLLKSKRDTGTEKNKQRKIPFKMMSVLFCLLRVHLLLSNLNTVYHVNDYMSDD